MSDDDSRAGLSALFFAKLAAFAIPAKHAAHTAKQFRDELQIAADSHELAEVALGAGAPSSYAVWLSKRYVEETCTQMRISWETYIKFYTVFFTINFTAVAVTIQYLENKPGRGAMCLAFIVQNLLASGTALSIGQRSVLLQRQCETFAQVGATMSNETLPTNLLTSPIVGRLGLYAGRANFVGHIVFILVWTSMFFGIG